MEFKKLKKRIQELEEEFNEQSVITRTIDESEKTKTRKEIISEMKKIGTETLPYAYDALEEFIDKETMFVHYNKHYKGYVDKLNKAIGKRQQPDLDLEEIVKGITRFNNNIRNNAGGAFNHALFWKMLTPKNTRASGPVYDLIIKEFGDFNNFKKKFEQRAKSQFGSGWVWLVLTNRGTLKIMTTTNQDNPLMNSIKNGGYPLLGLDLWEHAYYLKYKNKRDDYIKNFWKVINWNFVNNLYKQKTEKKINETKKVKEIIKEGVSEGCNRKQVNYTRMLFNNNPEIKNIFRKTIEDILKELFSDYWFERNEYGKGQFSGVYDFESPGRSVINKLNTNYTAFCILVNDVNKYLKSVGIDPISFHTDNSEQIKEVNRFARFLIELRYRIFSPNASTFKTIMNSLDKNNKFGDETELKAVIELKKFFDTPKVFKVGELGGADDMIGGVDAYMETDEGKKTFQIKPYNGTEENDGKITVMGTGNVKKYKTDYMVFFNDNLPLLVFNTNPQIIKGNYVFDVSDKLD